MATPLAYSMYRQSFSQPLEVACTPAATLAVGRALAVAVLAVTLRQEQAVVPSVQAVEREQVPSVQDVSVPETTQGGCSSFVRSHSVSSAFSHSSGFPLSVMVPRSEEH